MFTFYGEFTSHPVTLLGEYVVQPTLMWWRSKPSKWCLFNHRNNCLHTFFSYILCNFNCLIALVIAVVFYVCHFWLFVKLGWVFASWFACWIDVQIVHFWLPVDVYVSVMQWDLVTSLPDSTVSDLVLLSVTVYVERVLVFLHKCVKQEVYAVCPIFVLSTACGWRKGFNAALNRMRCMCVCVCVGVCVCVCVLRTLAVESSHIRYEFYLIRQADELTHCSETSDRNRRRVPVRGRRWRHIRVHTKTFFRHQGRHLWHLHRKKMKVSTEDILNIEKSEESLLQWAHSPNLRYSELRSQSIVIVPHRRGGGLLILHLHRDD